MKSREHWEDFVRLMHLPLPFCVLAFATIGAALSERVYLDRLALTYIGILLALCLTAYSFDELHQRPYHTQFSDRTLWLMAGVGLAGAIIVGIYLAITVSGYIIPLMALAGFFIFAYNLELFNGKFHNAAWFGISWGGLSTFGGYFVQASNLNASALIVSAMSALFSVGILRLTHKFRTSVISEELGNKIPTDELRTYSRHTRAIAWTIARIECYSMVLLAVGLIFPKLI